MPPPLTPPPPTHTQVVRDAQARLSSAYGPKAVAFEFCQVGKDQRAQAFLARLDTDPQVGGSIDCTSYYEMESAEYQKRGINLSPSMWLVKMMVRGVGLMVGVVEEGRVGGRGQHSAKTGRHLPQVPYSCHSSLL